MKFTFNRRILLAVVGAAMAGMGINAVLAGPGHDEDPQGTSTQSTGTASVAIETIVDQGLSSLISTNASWAGELLSTSDVLVHPLREGQIVEWHTRLGRRVSQGDVLGRLSAPPANLELAAALGERASALVMARAQAEATERLVADSKTSLLAVRAALERSRNASLAVASNEAEQTKHVSVGAEKELIALEAMLPVKRQAVRSALERTTYRLSGQLTTGGSSPSTSEGVANMRLKSGVGVYSEATRTDYRNALAILLSALRQPTALPLDEAREYLHAAQKLLSASSATEELSEEHLGELRTDLADDQQALNEATSELSSLEKEVISAKTVAANAGLAAGGVDDKRIMTVTETDAAVAERKAELDAKIAELERDLALARAEVDAAEAAYRTIATGLGGQDIVAPRSGTVSAVYKNIGDHVSPDIAVAAVSGLSSKGSYVRFRIPSDARRPDVGEEVAVERPGFPLDKARAKVTGVGPALDANGAYAAEADFIEGVDWPVHSSVRVVSSADKDGGILIPFSAVWWSDGGATNVWLVMENDVIRPQPIRAGRAVGDRIEVEEGLQIGDHYVLRPTPELKTGDSVLQAEGKQEAKEENAAAGGDGHGHAHDE